MGNFSKPITWRSGMLGLGRLPTLLPNRLMPLRQPNHKEPCAGVYSLDWERFIERQQQISRQRLGQKIGRRIEVINDKKSDEGYLA
ncbi:MAG: hypothetical protein CMQ69_02880 [Gammaproteobacteria bacterium]|nr:hypothetical protein [Gammaproteobacteria bacterium]MEC8358011.1 hypothetical protein [Pseudomonadota bacterium]